MRLTTDILKNEGNIDTEDTRSYGAASDGEVEDYILTFVEGPKIKVEESQSKELVEVGEIIRYTVNISNIGNIEVKNMKLINLLCEGVSYINGTVEVDGTLSLGDLTKGIDIPTLPQGGKSKVEFNTLINSIENSEVITNKTVITYINDNAIITEESNIVSAQVDISELTRIFGRWHSIKL